MRMSICGRQNKIGVDPPPPKSGRRLDRYAQQLKILHRSGNNGS